jgi:hypothetical protein
MLGKRWQSKWIRRHQTQSTALAGQVTKIHSRAVVAKVFTPRKWAPDLSVYHCLASSSEALLTISSQKKKQKILFAEILHTLAQFLQIWIKVIPSLSSE